MKDVDISITTRELARMIKEAGIDFNKLEDGTFDSPLGEATGAAVIFGATGGVAEAAVRTAVAILSDNKIDQVDFTVLRGEKGVKEFEVKTDKVKLRGVVVSGMLHAKHLLERLRKGDVKYDFIEIMACRGGCVCGGGQPIVSSQVKSDVNVFDLRSGVLYDIDKKSEFRRSHENPFVKELYENHYEKPLSHKAHEELHTTYSAKIKYPDVK